MRIFCKKDFHFLFLALLLVLQQACVHAQKDVQGEQLALLLNCNGYCIVHPPDISITLGDSTDAMIFGNSIQYQVVRYGKIDRIAAYQIKVNSNHQEVLPDSSITIQSADSFFVIRLKPLKAGFASVNCHVSGYNNTVSVELNIAVSVSPNAQAYWFTGMSDASAAIGIDHQQLWIADDETNMLALYNLHQSGEPVKTFLYEQMLPLSDIKGDVYKEVDCEAATKSVQHANRVYWMGSMSNGGSNYSLKTNRNTLFSTLFNGNKTAVSVADSYVGLREVIVKWGNQYGYQMSNSAASGKNPKATEGFNAEGMVFGADSTTLYIGMRAPLVPLGNRNKALLVPILQFEEWYDKYKHLKSPMLGAPVELDLGGRGVRDIIALPNGKYLIVAGASNSEPQTALFYWSGMPTDTMPSPIVLTFPIAAYPFEAAIPLTEKDGTYRGKVLLIADNGSSKLYGDDQATKYLSPAFKKCMALEVQLP